MAVQKEHFPKEKKPASKGKIDLSASGKAVLDSKELAEQSSAGLAGLFGIDNTGSQNDIIEIPRSKLVPFSCPELGFTGQPFKVVVDDDMLELAADIEKNGVMEPIIVKPHENEYMILSGHRRDIASGLANRDTIPARIRDVDMYTAAQIVSQTNLLRRTRILPSERAFAYKLRYEALKQKGGRPAKGREKTDQAKVRTDELVAAEFGESRSQVQKYMRLTELIPSLLDKVDDGSIPVTAGTTLSFLPASAQREVFSLLEESGRDMTIDLAEQIKALKPLSDDAIRDAIIPQTEPREKKEKAPKADKPRTITIAFSELQDFFDEYMDDTEIVHQIKEALSFTVQAQAQHNQPHIEVASP